MKPRPRPAGAVILMMLAASLNAQQSDPSLRSGPMLGYSEMTEVMVWVQTTRPAVVTVRYRSESDPEDAGESSVRTEMRTACVARITIGHLTPGTRYAYDVLIDDVLVELPYRSSFKTQTLWQWRTDPPEFTVAIGSCLYVNEPLWDRPGTPYGSEYEILNTIASLRPDAMVWLGDNTYYREVDWNTVGGLRHRWTHTRSLPELQPLLASTHNYFIWDDHDYGPNDADRTFRLRSEALENHILFTANQTYGTLETPGAFGRFEWADVEFILLDDRFYRSPNSTDDSDPAKTMWGDAQLRWIKDVLLNSRAPFKLVVNGNQVLNPIVQHEGLAHFSREYDDLLGFIKAHRVPGVVFLTGDRHMSELIRLEDSSFYPLYDFTSSALTAGTSSPRGPEVNNPYRVPGTLVSDAHSFGLLRVSGPRTDRTLTLECRDVSGTVRWKHDLRARDLRPPRRGARD